MVLVIQQEFKFFLQSNTTNKPGSSKIKAGLETPETPHMCTCQLLPGSSIACGTKTVAAMNSPYKCKPLH